MSRQILATCATTLALLSSNAWAQLPDGGVGRNPITRPTVSPYLNLFNNQDNGVGFNYYNFVRPQQQFRQAATQMSQEIGALQSNVGQIQKMQQAPTEIVPVTTGRMARTGHAATFNSTGGYYPTTTGNRGASQSFGGSRTPRR